VSLPGRRQSLDRARLRPAGAWRACAVWLLCTAGAPAHADPMRPLIAPAAAASAAEGTPAVPTSGAAPEPQVRRLLAIREENSGARAALFGDRWLRAGDRFTAPEGETLVLAVGAHHIELERGKLRSTHHLLAPLLPPQWPALPAGAAAGSTAASARSDRRTKAYIPPTPPTPPTQPPLLPVTTAPRIERP
jgi:hypothetical protein